jgi:hypothetical protein
LHDGKVGESGKREKIFASVHAPFRTKSLELRVIAAALDCIRFFHEKPWHGRNFPRSADVCFVIDAPSAFLAKLFLKEINKWLDMISGEADSAGAGLPAHRGGFTNGQNEKDNERKTKS